MPETLLIIDGRGHPDALVEALEAGGYFCVYARGPMKAKALLREHPVALIVWKDNTGNADLSKDLVRIWKSHPRIPVVQLYAHGLRTGAVELGQQVRATLPVEAAEAQLLDVIGATLAAQRPAAPRELEVLGAATASRRSRERPNSAGVPVPAISVRAPEIGVGLDERRTLLGPHPSANSERPGLFSRVRARISRLRAQQPAEL